MTKILEVTETDYSISTDNLFNKSYWGKFIVSPPNGTGRLGDIGYCSKNGKSFLTMAYDDETFKEYLNVLKGIIPPSDVSNFASEGVELSSIVDTLSQHTKASALQKFSFDELKQLKEMGLL